MSIVLVGLAGASFTGRRECTNGGGWSCEKDRGGLWFGAKLISETRLSRSE
jgi:hypothetical protein